MTAAHPLDRPVWSSLTSRQAPLAIGDARAVRLDPDYGLFAAAADGSAESLAALAALVPPQGAIATVGVAEPGPVPGANAEPHLISQMVCERLTEPGRSPDFAILPLADADAPQMLALATLTRPGPFFARTYQLGDFVGVKDPAGKLLAMAGERMKPTGFIEVSGVCTNPDCRGRGYAGALMRVVAGRILARGDTPFLHSYAHNTGAIGLYESLGFSLRREVVMTVLTRA
jgi:predicted GNAT family acetyltransferase